jgi:molybdenum cofactor biosynthesis protein MoaC
MLSPRILTTKFVDPQPRRTEFSPGNRTVHPLTATIHMKSRLNKRMAVDHSRSFTTTNQQTIPSPTSLTHFDTTTGRARMVDVDSKASTQRTVTASGRILVPKIAYDLVVSHGSPTAVERCSGNLHKAKEKARKKGDVLAVSQVAGIMACKRTAELIPLCHPLPITHIDVSLTPEVKSDGTRTEYSVKCEATVSCTGKTGVEMEALTGVSVALLNVWDMLKAIAGREMEIQGIVVDKKSGGQSEDFFRPPVL